MRWIGALVAFAVCLSSAAAWGDDWKKLGSEKLGKTDHEASFHVGADQGHFRFIKLKAEGGRVEVKKVTVSFTHGDEKQIDHVQALEDGEETRSLTIELAVKHPISRIQVKYDVKGDDIKLLAYGRRGD